MVEEERIELAVQHLRDALDLFDKVRADDTYNGAIDAVMLNIRFSLAQLGDRR